MGNVIADRVAFFLKDHPPFEYLPYEELERVSVQLSVRFAESGEILFNEGDAGQPFAFILNQGVVKLTLIREGNSQLVDECEPGDVFGVRSLISGNKYIMTATCEEECLLYQIPADLFSELLDTQPSFSKFFALGYASGQAIARSDKNSATYSSLDEQPVTMTLDVLRCSGETPIAEAARMMTDRGVGSIIISGPEHTPEGIVTDSDLRKKVIAVGLDTGLPIRKIMSFPVQTIPPDFSFSEILIRMMRSRVHHLIITEDGTPDSKITGVISDHDVMISQQNHPAALIKELRKEKDPEKWPELRNKAEDVVRDYLDKDLSISLISNFITEINDTLIIKSLKLAMKEFPEGQEMDLCWLSLGSEGREEQLLRTDQDNAIIFREREDLESDRALCLKIGQRINELLMTSGFAECPANIMARNPELCLSLEEWKRKFRNWIEEPEARAVMNSTIFFDFRAVFGDLTLADSLANYLAEELLDNEIFFGHLAANALQNPPPLGFFKNLLVERSGEHEDSFDIKKRGMMPLADAARAMILNFRDVSVQNTPDRFRKLAELDPSNYALMEESAQAYELMMKIRARNGLKNKDSGRFVDIESMNKLEKQMLKTAFLPIKDLQEILEIRFRTNYFR